MDNYAIADNFSLLSKLMDIHGDDPNRSKTYSIAAFNIEKLPVQLQDTPREKLFSIKGIGESIGRKVIDMLDTGEFDLLTDYIAKTPPGVVEMMGIKGIGPKKIHVIWKQMGIESVSDLEIAGKENKLAVIKGFGEKTQQNILESISFISQNEGNFLYAQVDAIYSQIEAFLEKLFPGKIHVTGAFRRQELTLEEIEFVVLEKNEIIKPKFQTAQPPELLEEKSDTLLYKLKNGLRLRLHTGKGNMDERLFLTTGTTEFTSTFKKLFPKVSGKKTAVSDETFFEQAGIQFIHPARRNDAAVIADAKKKIIKPAIATSDIKSIIHSHSNWSDGVSTIEVMASELIKRGFEYLVISDHSKAAAYANGLSEDRIREQHRYVDELNNRIKPFRVFKSIECDILTDGSLDYNNNILSTFDLVIVSIHSNFKMDVEKATTRLIKAVSNPYVTILGHMTGRLLLSRNGYPVDHKRVIDACAENHVVIELNAHPKRLDMDWKFIDYALEKGVLISIDPDAHSVDEFDNIKYGVLAAQKSNLTKDKNVSSFSLKEFEKFLADRKKKKKI